MRGRHTSAGKELDRSLRWLENQAGVKKVVLGLTEACRHRYTPGHLKYQRDGDGGFHIKGYSGNGVVNAFVVAGDADKQAIVKAMRKRFE